MDEPGRERGGEPPRVSGEQPRASGGPPGVSVSGDARVEKLTVINNARDVRMEFPEPSPPHAPPAQLPPDIADFVGRQAELEELGRLVREAADEGSALVISAIAGRPGVGKSALARRLARELAPGFPDGQLYADLQGDTQGAEPGTTLAPGDVLGSFLRALGVPDRDIPGPVADRAGLYRTRLAGRRVLVLLDNAHDEAQVRPLLPGGSGSAVLVTSRRALAVEGARLLLLDTFSEAEAIELLGQIAGIRRVSAEPEHAADVARLCGYLPLALRITGARLATRTSWTLAHVARLLRHERGRLAQLSYGDLDVRASFMLSYRELAPDEARLFRRLGVLVSGDFHAALAGYLHGEGGTPPDEARKLVTALADAMLIEETAPDFYRVHDLIWLFAAERLREEEGEEAAEQALYTMLVWYFGKVTIMPALLRPDSGADDATRRDMLFWLDSEWPTLVTTVQMAARRRMPGYIGQVGLALMPFLHFRGAWDGAERLGEAIRTCAELTDQPELVASGLSQIHTAQYRQGHLTDAVATGRRTIDAARAAGRLDFEIEANQMLARIFQALGDDEARLAALRAAGVLADRGEDPCAGVRTRFLELTTALDAEVAEPDRDRLHADMAGVLAQAEATGCHSIAAQALNVMGAMRDLQGDRREAVSLWRRALSIATDHAEPMAEATARENIGIYELDIGHRARAREHFRRALEVYLGQGFHNYAAPMAVFLGNLARRAGSWEEAADSYSCAADLFAQLGDETGEGNMRVECANALSHLGRTDEAEQQLGAAQEIFERLGFPERVEETRHALSWLRAHADDQRQGQRHTKTDRAQVGRITTIRTVHGDTNIK